MTDRRLRFASTGGQATWFVTLKTEQGRLLLRPSPEVNDRLVGCLGQSLRVHEAQFHAWVALSNHIHMIVTCTAERLAELVGHFKSASSVEIGRHLHDWTGGIWRQSYHAQEILDEAAYDHYFSYLASHGAKEFLVDRAEKWPGSHTLDALRGKGPLRGTWIDRTGYHDACARRRKDDPSPDIRDYHHPRTVEPVPPPFWADLTADQQRDRVRQILRTVNDQAATERVRQNRNPKGVKAIVAEHPHTRPDHTDNSPMRSACLTSSPEALIAWKNAYNNYVTARAIVLLKMATDGVKAALFPPEGIRPWWLRHALTAAFP